MKSLEELLILAEQAGMSTEEIDRRSTPTEVAPVDDTPVPQDEDLFVDNSSGDELSDIFSDNEVSVDEEVDELSDIFSDNEVSLDEDTAALDHKIGALIGGVAQGLTFGTSDEIEAGLSSIFGLLSDYDETLLAVQKRMDENKRVASGYELTGQLGSMVGTGVAAAGTKIGKLALKKLGAMGTSAKVGSAGVVGSADSVIRGTGERRIDKYDPDSLLSDAVDGFAYGLGGYGIGRAFGGILDLAGAGAKKTFRGIMSGLGKNVDVDSSNLRSLAEDLIDSPDVPINSMDDFSKLLKSDEAVYNHIVSKVGREKADNILKDLAENNQKTSDTINEFASERLVATKPQVDDIVGDVDAVSKQVKDLKKALSFSGSATKEDVSKLIINDFDAMDALEKVALRSDIDRPLKDIIEKLNPEENNQLMKNRYRIHIFKDIKDASRNGQSKPIVWRRKNKKTKKFEFKDATVTGDAYRTLKETFDNLSNPNVSGPDASLLAKDSAKGIGDILDEASPNLKANKDLYSAAKTSEEVGEQISSLLNNPKSKDLSKFIVGKSDNISGGKNINSVDYARIARIEITNKLEPLLQSRNFNKSVSNLKTLSDNKVLMKTFKEILPDGDKFVDSIRGVSNLQQSFKQLAKDTSGKVKASEALFDSFLSHVTYLATYVPTVKTILMRGALNSALKNRNRTIQNFGAGDQESEAMAKLLTNKNPDELFHVLQNAVSRGEKINSFKEMLGVLSAAYSLNSGVSNDSPSKETLSTLGAR